MMFGDINLIAVLGAAIASMIIGSIWYSPSVLGTHWMKAARISPEDMEHSKRKGMTQLYLWAFIGALVTAYVLSMFIHLAGASTAVEGGQVEFWIWLGFAAPGMLSSVLWESKSMQYYAINVLHVLVNLVVAGGILAVWG